MNILFLVGLAILLTVVSSLIGGLFLWPLWNFGPAAAFGLPEVTYMQAVCIAAALKVVGDMFKVKVELKK